MEVNNKPKILDLEFFYYSDVFYSGIEEFIERIEKEYGEDLNTLTEEENIEITIAEESSPYEIKNPLIEAEKRVKRYYNVIDTSVINKIRSDLIEAYREYNKKVPIVHLPKITVTYSKQELIDSINKRKFVR